MNKKNVTASKPRVGGAIYVAPEGTQLPKNATEELDGAFKNLGYAGDEGIKNSTENDADTVKAWGGDTVLTLSKGRKDKFEFKLIEALSKDVLELVYGVKNVSGDLEKGLTININNTELGSYSYVIDMILSGGVLKRIVIPSAKISNVGEITYKDNDTVSYNVTLQCYADLSGNTHYEYIMGRK